MALMLEAITHRHEVIVPQQVVDECVRVARNKRPVNSDQLRVFLMSADISVVSATDSHTITSPTMRDIADQPILDTAIAHDVDIVISGDRDFHALLIGRPRIMTATQFREEFMTDDE